MRLCLRLATVALISWGVLGCSQNAPSAAGDAAIRGPDGRHSRADNQSFGAKEADAMLRLERNAATGETIVDSDHQEPHYVGDGNGHFKFAYWIIYYRPNSNTCQFFYTIHARAFTQSGPMQSCGNPPDTHVFYKTHIKDADIVP